MEINMKHGLSPDALLVPDSVLFNPTKQSSKSIQEKYEWIVSNIGD